jgi:hypothetical protein
MKQRSAEELEAFLTEQGIALNDRAFELELNSYGWRVVGERKTRQAILLWIECAVECDESIPRNLTVASDDGRHDRDIALMRALEKVLDYGFLKEELSPQDA